MSSDPNPLFRFGVIADPQYAAIAAKPETGRYYANSLDKLRDAIATLNGEDLAFVITLGDIIDRGWHSFDDILPLYQQSRHEPLFLLGNHDFDVPDDRLATVHRRLGMPAPYYDFARGGLRFVCLDGNDVSTFAPPAGDPRRALAETRLQALKDRGAVNAYPWNGSLSDTQFNWLKGVLERAEADGEKVIVMGHYPIYPENSHNMWDARRVVDLLTASTSFVAYFNGHDHDGNFAEIDGRAFVNFKGMVDTESENTFAVVEVFADRLNIRGFGREDSRVLKR
jgi:hypothetical protein